MDAKTLESLGAVLKEVSVSHDRKVSDGEYGSRGYFFSLTLQLAPGVDVDAIALAAQSWAEAKVNEALGTKASAEALFPAAIGPVDGDPAPAPKPEPVRVPDGDGSQETDVFKVDNFTIEERNGKRCAFVRGGKFVKYGVRAWPESFAAIGIDLNTLELEKPYTLPIGITEAVYVLENGKPRKVTSFR